MWNTCPRPRPTAQRQTHRLGKKFSHLCCPPVDERGTTESSEEEPSWSAGRLSFSHSLCVFICKTCVHSPRHFPQAKDSRIPGIIWLRVWKRKKKSWFVFLSSQAAPLTSSPYLVNFLKCHLCVTDGVGTPNLEGWKGASGSITALQLLYLMCFYPF